LLQEKISADVIGEKEKYDTFFKKFNKAITIGVGLIMFGLIPTIILCYFGDINNNEMYNVLGGVAIMFFLLIAVPIFVYYGIAYDNFKKANEKIANIYSDDEKIKARKKFAILITSGVVLIILALIPIIILSNSEQYLIFGEVVFMLALTIAVPMFVYAGLQEEKFDIKKYNGEEKKSKKLIEKITSTIMLTVLAIFLLTGWVYSIWRINWVVFPIGGILCAIVNSIVGEE
jgi:MFS family permease